MGKFECFVNFFANLAKNSRHAVIASGFEKTAWQSIAKVIPKFTRQRPKFVILRLLKKSRSIHEWQGVPKFKAWILRLRLRMTKLKCP